MKNIYKVGCEYIDKAQKKASDDQLLRWLNKDNITIQNCGGIRIKSYTRIDKKITDNLPSSVFLFTEKTNRSTGLENPWNDSINIINDDIEYWGDAKHDPLGKKKELLDWNGNRHLNNIYTKIQSNDLFLIPPIFHFTKYKQGKILFNGLFVIKNLLIEEFNHKSHIIKNYKVILNKLKVDEINLEWINYRSSIDEISELNNINLMSLIPNEWSNYIKGDIHV